MLFSDFKKKWNSIPHTPRGYLTLGLEHKLEFEIGYYSTNYKSLIILNSGKVENVPSSYAVGVLNTEWKRGQWILEFQLLREAYEEEFLRLCWDMIESTKESAKPLQDFLNKYLTWQRLLQREEKTILSFSAQKGLLGELLFLDECLGTMEAQNAVDAWQGPEGGDQDFVFPDSWAEVKTVALASQTLKISSLEQLDRNVSGVIRVYILEKGQDSGNQYNLADAAKIIHEKLALQPQVCDRFEMKLFKAGYRENEEEAYKANVFRLIECRTYDVGEKFPRLTHSNTRPEIVAGSYELSLSALESYRR